MLAFLISACFQLCLDLHLNIAQICLCKGVSAGDIPGQGLACSPEELIESYMVRLVHVLVSFCNSEHELL